MGNYILALDQGTTSSRAILFDREQNMIAVSQKEFTQYYPQEGWVEQDPMEIYSSQYAVMMEAVAQSGIDVQEIAGIGITNQRETTILWDKTTGRPIYNAIVWQCRRTAELVDELRILYPGKYRFNSRCLFFCNKNQMDFGSCPRRQGTGRTGRNPVWDSG